MKRNETKRNETKRNETKRKEKKYEKALEDHVKNLINHFIQRAQELVKG